MSTQSAKGSMPTHSSPAYLHRSSSHIPWIPRAFSPTPCCLLKERNDLELKVNLEEYLFLEVCGGGKSPSQGFHLTYIFFLTVGESQSTQSNPHRQRENIQTPASLRGDSAAQLNAGGSDDLHWTLSNFLWPVQLSKDIRVRLVGVPITATVASRWFRSYRLDPTTLERKPQQLDKTLEEKRNFKNKKPPTGPGSGRGKEWATGQKAIK